jgi:hypothetical protein
MANLRNKKEHTILCMRIPFMVTLQASNSVVPSASQSAIEFLSQRKCTRLLSSNYVLRSSQLLHNLFRTVSSHWEGKGLKSQQTSCINEKTQLMQFLVLSSVVLKKHAKDSDGF